MLLEPPDLGWRASLLELACRNERTDDEQVGLLFAEGGRELGAMLLVGERQLLPRLAKHDDPTVGPASVAASLARNLGRNSGRDPLFSITAILTGRLAVTRPSQRGQWSGMTAEALEPVPVVVSIRSVAPRDEGRVLDSRRSRLYACEVACLSSQSDVLPRGVTAIELSMAAF